MDECWVYEKANHTIAPGSSHTFPRFSPADIVSIFWRTSTNAKKKRYVGPRHERVHDKNRTKPKPAIDDKKLSATALIIQNDKSVPAIVNYW